MKLNSLNEKGLSLSQAASVSNLCFQRATDIQNLFLGINNVTKTLKVNDQEYTKIKGKPLPDNTIILLGEKAILHGVQAFLMQNIKAKAELIKLEEKKEFFHELEIPVKKPFVIAKEKPYITEEQSWDFLLLDEYEEYLQNEATAAHVGQFIHKNGVLDDLRKDLLTVTPLEWFEVKDGERTPVNVVAHHTPEELLQLHNELAVKHRQAEQKVNYVKAKVKNLCTLHNAEVAQFNADEQAKAKAANMLINEEYQKTYKEYSDELLALKQKFEGTRLMEIKRLSSLRILVPQRFKDVVDKLLVEVKVN